jgi:Cof subfamily protein (haloacid dehalogenase superfamily)
MTPPGTPTLPRASDPGPLFFAIDVDGTLLTSRHELTPASVAAIHAIRDRGAEVLLTTSRPPPALWPILARLDLVEPAAFVGSQGAITGSYSADGRLRVIDQHPMPLDLARAAVDVAVRKGFAVNWYSGERWLVSRIDETVAREAEIVGCTPVVADLSAETTGPDKLLLIAPPSRPAAMASVVPALPGLRAQTSNPTYLEVTAPHVDKASALRAYCRERRIPPGAVVAIGDGMNDLGMLEFAGLAVAPANARPEVLAAADVVTTSNDDDGVARLLQAILAPR